MTKKRTIEFGLGAAVAVAAFALGAVAASAASGEADAGARIRQSERRPLAAGRVTFNPFSISRRVAPHRTAGNA
jgi:hypothetical protein